MHTKALIFLVTILLTAGLCSAQSLPEILKSPIPGFANLDSMPAEELQAWGSELISRAEAILDYENARMRVLNSKADSLNFVVETAKLDTTIERKEIREQSRALKQARDNADASQSRIEAANLLLERCNGYSSSNSDVQRAFLPSLWGNVDQTERELRQFAGFEAPLSDAMPASNAAKQYAQYNPKNDVMLNPPKTGCMWVVNEQDAFSGEIRRVSQKEELFRFTNPNLIEAYGKKPQAIAHGNISQTGDIITLTVTLKINDKNAKNTFGSLNQGSPAFFKLLDGSTLTLRNAVGDEGIPSADNLSYSFKGQYVLDKSTIKRLSRTGLDKLRLTWATGYEDYDIQNVDYLMRALECF